MTSIRSIARKLGLSTATVSSALSGTGRVAPGTRMKVQEAASLLGYRGNPLRSSIMSELRRSRKSASCGEFAVVNFSEKEGPRLGTFNRELLTGAQTRAANFDFKVTEFLVGRGGMSLTRLDDVLNSRNIQGILILPSRETPDWSQLNWRRYAGIYADSNMGDPMLHCVCCDHFRSIHLLLDRVTKRGYRRPGLFLIKRRDEHAGGRWTAGYQTFQRLHALKDEPPVPPLIIPEACESDFAPWFRQYQPDLVISHHTEAIAWMENCGARVPETHGFASLNLTVKTRPGAGLDLQPHALGERAMEQLVGQLLRNERGIPESPLTTTVLARWMEGPTVRSVQLF